MRSIYKGYRTWAQYTKDTDHDIQTLLSEKIKVELENEQLYASLKQKDELHDSLKETYEVRLKDKDNTIQNLQDRIQSYLYDVQGGLWSKVPGETIQHVSADRVDPRGTQEQTHTSSSSNSGIQTNMNRTLNTEDNNGTYDILMVYGSICKDIDINRLLRGTNTRGVKQTTYTVPEVQKSTIILHVGINDLKKMSANEAFIDYGNVVKILMEKSNSYH